MVDITIRVSRLEDIRGMIDPYITHINFVLVGGFVVDEQFEKNVLKPLRILDITYKIVDNSE